MTPKLLIDLTVRAPDSAAPVARASRGVVFRTEPHKIATLPDREVWLADFQDTEGNTLALMSAPPLRGFSYGAITVRNRSEDWSLAPQH